VDEHIAERRNGKEKSVFQTGIPESGLPAGCQPIGKLPACKPKNPPNRLLRRRLRIRSQQRRLLIQFAEYLLQMEAAKA
jgi:hypothetical protein